MTPRSPRRAAASVSAAVARDPATGVVEVRLANGLLALVLPIPDLPIVSVQTWYRVGSREEEKGLTGLAHFLEHLMFKGTATLRRGDIDRVTMKNGGANNADTTTDRTRYYFSFASDRCALDHARRTVSRTSSKAGRRPSVRSLTRTKCAP